jgi:hypothetical protein
MVRASSTLNIFLARPWFEHLTIDEGKGHNIFALGVCEQ